MEVNNFNSRIVSEGQEIGIIHGRIVENLYNDPLVICDVSSRNPNVMFELGMRITFDKPVIIIKDDEPSKIFDTDIIEFIPYPRDLRYNAIVKFKEILTTKIVATYKAGLNGDYSVFLKHFKDIKPTKLQEKEMGFEDIINKRFDDLYSLLQKRQEPISNILSTASVLEKNEVYKRGQEYVENYLKANIQDQKLFFQAPNDILIDEMIGDATSAPEFFGFNVSEIRTALVYGLTYYGYSIRKALNFNT